MSARADARPTADHPTDSAPATVDGPGSTATGDGQAGALDRRPSRTGSALSVLAGSVVVVALLPAWPGPVVAATGLIALAGGLVRASRRLFGAGAILQFAGVIVAGTVGAPPEPVLVATAATVVAWDVGEYALSLGAQLGRAARTDRPELVHAAASTGVAAAVSAVASLAYVGVDRGQPTLTLVLLLFGAVVLATALR